MTPAPACTSPQATCIFLQTLRPLHAASLPQVLDLIGAHPQRTLFLDDSVRNVGSAQELGIACVLIGRAQPGPEAELVATDIHQLPTVVPELFESQQEGGGSHDAGKAAEAEGARLAAVDATGGEAVAATVTLPGK